MEQRNRPTTILIHSAPYGQKDPAEALDLSMVLATFDFKVNLIFCGDGIYGLLKNQQPDKQKCYTATYKSLPFYDVDPIYVRKSDMLKQNLTDLDLICPVTSLDDQAVNKLIQTSLQVWNF
jgi:tRNA 2-thiouridine synthesizing protein C|tara:strand:- start:3304 stop:3666 length:363 start_codon:yes stop_codon:yes gene_type:complete